MEVLYTPDNWDIYLHLSSEELLGLKRIGDTIWWLLISVFTEGRLLGWIDVEVVPCHKTPWWWADCMRIQSLHHQVPWKILISSELIHNLKEKKKEMIRMWNELLDFKIDDYMRKSYITNLLTSNSA